MIDINIYESQTCKTVSFGRKGENLARRVLFDLSALIAEFGTGSFEWVIRRPHESTVYIAINKAQDGNTAILNLTATDTAISGYGGLELRYYVDDIIVKTIVWRTSIAASLGGGDVPDPIEDYIDQMREIAQEASESADAAGDSATQAAVSATNAAGSATEAAGYAANAAASAGAAADSATDSAASASAAHTSETNAANSATAAAGSATQAANSASAASGSASQAASSVTQAAGSASAAANSATQAAQSATAAAQSATAANQSAQDIAASSAQIETNRTDITELKNDLDEAIEEFAVPTQEAVNNWLDEHPEATTTVQDGAITQPKFSSDTLPYYTLIPDNFDGTDTEKLQACLNELTNGGYIVINREYTVVADLIHTLDSNRDLHIIFIGIGKNAKINMGSHTFVGTWSGSNATGNLWFNNITFVGTGTCFDCDTLIRLSIESCRFKGFDKVFSATTNGSRRMQTIYISNCLFWQCGDILYSNEGAVYDVKFLHNRVERCRSVAYFYGQTSTYSVCNLVIRDCLLEAITGTCIRLSTCRNVIIDSNYFEGADGYIVFASADAVNVKVTNNFVSNDDSTKAFVTIANKNDGDNGDLFGSVENNHIKYASFPVLAFSNTPTGKIRWRVAYNKTATITYASYLSSVYNDINKDLLYLIGNSNQVKIDFNNYTTQGVYHYGGGTTVSNYPSSNYGVLEVMKSLYILQRFTDASGSVYVRLTTNSGATWTAWAQV